MHRLQAFFLVFFFYLSFTFIALVLCEDLSFNFRAFDGRIVLKGDASQMPTQIQLTGSNRSQTFRSGMGRATYHEPMHLWDKSTGNVADFTTKFSFIINSEYNEPYGDGLTFFLAPNGSDIPSNSSGGHLALVSATDPFDSSTAFVAVEFDTFYDDLSNFWDPQCEHVGIDLNNIASVNHTCVHWFKDKIMSGGWIQATITYNSSTQNLSVLMTDAPIQGGNVTKLHHSVNLKEHLPEWVIVGFSAATGGSFELHTLYSWEFSSNLVVTKHVNSTINPSPADTNTGDKVRAKGSKSWVWSVIGLGFFLLLSLVLGLAWFVYRSKKKTNDQIGDEDDVLPIDEEFDQVTGPKKFSFRDLVVATDNFADARLLGKGGFGRVYEGCLIGVNTIVAIKKITPESRQGIKEYATEVKTISRLRHRNLVQLIGWCHEKKELLLIYEFMSNGGLDSQLFEHSSFLTWEKRYRIAQGIASALLYLHEEWEQCVVHRDIKSSNIMLDSDFNPKLGDFGLARLVDHAKGARTTMVAGTMGYMAPECIYTGKASKESDVYSFGIVLLEIACGRRVVDSLATEDQIWLVDWAWELYGIGKLLDAVDPKLGNDFDEKQLERLMIVGLWCAHPDSKVRPSIREALTLLNFDASPPFLPSTLPVRSCLAPSPSIVSTWLLPLSLGASTDGELVRT